MNKFLISTVLVSALISTGCAITVPAQGLIRDTNETFTGSTTGYVSGSGVLTVLSNKGTTCVGNFVYATSRQGNGIFKCDDGRTGVFEFTSAGTHGIGTGEIDGHKITFTFGK